MLLYYPTVDVNKTDCYGVNSFWIASFYGHIDVIFYLIIRIDNEIVDAETGGLDVQEPERFKRSPYRCEERPHLGDLDLNRHALPFGLHKEQRCYCFRYSRLEG